MQLNSSLILLLLVVVVVVGFGPFFVFFFYTPNPFVGSRHSPLTFPPFFNIFLRVWYPPLSAPHSTQFCLFQGNKTTSFFLWITITKSSRYTIFSENRVFSSFYLAVYWKFPFLFRHFTQVIYDTGNRINILKKRDKKTGMSSGHSERSWWMMTYSVCVIKDSIFDLEKKEWGKENHRKWMKSNRQVGVTPDSQPLTRAPIIISRYCLSFHLQDTTNKNHRKKKTKKKVVSG